eukprot:2611543-Ditylum_brightwellii.AAC.1
MVGKAPIPEMPVVLDEIKAIKQQHNIGWQQLFKGRITSAWLSIQDKYLNDIKLKTNSLNGATWSTQL